MLLADGLVGHLQTSLRLLKRVNPERRKEGGEGERRERRKEGEGEERSEGGRGEGEERGVGFMYMANW